jgi:hypothetical protein
MIDDGGERGITPVFEQEGSSGTNTWCVRPCVLRHAVLRAQTSQCRARRMRHPACRSYEPLQAGTLDTLE